MAAEYYINTNPQDWVFQNTQIIENVFSRIGNIGKYGNNIYCLYSKENKSPLKDFPDVIFRLLNNQKIFMMEIYAHPYDVTIGIINILEETKKYVELEVLDDDGEISIWSTIKKDDIF